MAVGWKSFGTVGAASVVCVGALYGVLVREPATTTSQPVNAVSGSQPTAPAANNTSTSSAETSAPTGSTPQTAGTQPAKPDPAQPASGQPAPAGQGGAGKPERIIRVDQRRERDKQQKAQQHQSAEQGHPVACKSREGRPHVTSPCAGRARNRARRQRG